MSYYFIEAIWVHKAYTKFRKSFKAAIPGVTFEIPAEKLEIDKCFVAPKLVYFDINH